MFLTEDEYKILQGLREGLSRTKIKEKYGVQMYMNDPRITSLAKKYGVDIYDDMMRTEIAKKADLAKATIVSKEEMPYFEYINLELADYIDINKRDVEQLYEYFKNVPDDNWWHTHRLYRTEDGLGTVLYIKDLKTGKMSKLRMVVDGDEYIGDDEREVN